ncbi:MAG: N-acetyl-gamma-glutamyl-phosphate reductase [Planctomycetota bacterium]|nr:MAG: N-acetyl-gamma-glutamyl-phosphate reductase [Planctomycetota bacterium]
MPSDRNFSIGIIGARGFVGAELIGLIARHPHFTLAYAASRSQAGQPVPVIGGGAMTFVDAVPNEVRRIKTDAVVLAVPDGATDEFVNALSGSVILDLSSDHRFDDSWAYGLSEHFVDAISGAKRIANPGCYATAVQLAIRPLLPILDGVPHAFGVSGYSGAGTTPSPRNDPKLLADGITPYKLVGHTHEREVSRHLGVPVRFSPHVAPFFRGITVTVQARLAESASVDSLTRAYVDAYGSSRLIRVLGERVPRVQDIVGDPGAEIGGITVGCDGRDAAVVCTVDNLLKGAASQAIQNLNLVFGLDAETGLIEDGDS